MIRVRCDNFKQAAALAINFSKLYSDGRIYQPLREPTVEVDMNTFVFVYDGKPKKDEVSKDTFIKKYFTQK